MELSLFLVQRRVVQNIPGEDHRNFPAEMEGEVIFGPEDAFGVHNDNRTTLPVGKSGQMNVDLGEGKMSFAGPYIEEISASNTDGTLATELRGNLSPFGR